MIGREEYSFGYHSKSGEVWFHRLWVFGNDYVHEYWWQPTLGMDGVE